MIIPSHERNIFTVKEVQEPLFQSNNHLLFIQQTRPENVGSSATLFFFIGIIVGIIIGVLVLAAILVIVYFLLKYRKERMTVESAKTEEVPAADKMTVMTPSVVDKTALRHNLDPVKKSILQAIHNGDVLFQSDIPDVFKLTKSRVSEILSEFEQLNLIKREKAGRTNRIHSLIGNS